MRTPGSALTEGGRTPLSTVLGLLLVFISSTLIACAGEATEESRSGNELEHGEIDFSSTPPLLDGVPVTSVSEAGKTLQFMPALPTNVDGPTKMYVSGASDLEPDQRNFVAVFENTAQGTFWLTEYLTTVTQEDLEGFAASCDPDHGCEMKETIVTLGDGTRALQKIGPETVSLAWIDVGVYVDVLGPSASFSADGAIDIANSIDLESAK